MERRTAASTSKHSCKINMEQKQSQEKRDTYGEHTLKRDKVRGKYHSQTKKVHCREKRITYISERENKEETAHVTEKGFD